MAANGWQRAVAVIGVTVFLATSCTSLQTVNIPTPGNPPALPAVKVGDTVVITTKDAHKKRFKITAVEADALVGKGERVPYADMATLSAVHVRKGATTALVVTIVFAVLAIAAAAETADAINEILSVPGD